MLSEELQFNQKLAVDHRGSYLLVTGIYSIREILTLPGKLNIF